MKSKSAMAVKYVGRVYKVGNPTSKILISVPRREWARVEKLIGKDLLVTLEEVIKE